MKKQTLIVVLLILFLTTFSSCSVVEGIFKTGMGVGIFLVVFVIALIVFFVSRLGKNTKQNKVIDEQPEVTSSITGSE